MSEKKKRNIIIGSLCGVLLLMGIGYSAFATVINIGGTSNITSNWNVKITNIQSKNIIGGATNVSSSYNDLTASFRAELISPGDSITYDIRITNAGSLDAFLEQILVSKPTNSAFSISTSGVKKGDILSAGSSAILTVVISYSNSVTSQPENTEGELEITLDYIQKEAAEGSYIVNNVLKVTGTGIGSWFGHSFDKYSMKTITIKDNMEAPDNAVAEYDIGEVPGNVLMWVDSGNNVIIGADGPIMANANSRYLFGRFPNVTEINGLENLDTSNVTDMVDMFYDMSSLTSLDLSNFDTSNVTDMQSMFANMSSLTSLDLSNFDTSNVTNMQTMFAGTSSLTSLNVSNFDTSKVTNMVDMFRDLSKLTSLNVSNFDTSNVTSMPSMFSGMNSLTSLDLSNFDTSKVTNMHTMFYNMSSLTSLNLSNFDTSNVTRMDNMFSGMSSLTSLNVSNFDTSKVTIMPSMFRNLSKLTSLNVSNFDTSNVTSMGGMFYGMSSLTSLNLSNFDTSKVTDMGWMFAENRNLTSLDLSNFDTSKVTRMDNMFTENRNLKSIDFRKATFGSVTNYERMFYFIKIGATIYTKNTTTKAWLQDKYPSGNYIIP